MRNSGKVLFLLATCLFTFSCTSTQANNYLMWSQKDSQVLLEIDSVVYGSMDSFNGRNLNFRLFENGEFEYEEISDEKLKDFKTSAFSSEITIRKQGQLSTEDLSVIKEILAKPDLQKVDYFKNKEGFCTCGASRLEIRFRNQTGFILNINIDGNGCTDLRNPNPKVFPNFSKSVSQLIEKIQSIKSLI